MEIQSIVENIPINIDGQDIRDATLSSVRQAVAVVQQDNLRTLGRTHERLDALNYGRADRHMWPLDMSKVLRLREMGKWIR